jgi:hypothetical protein
MMIFREDILHAGKGIEQFDCRDKEKAHARPNDMTVVRRPHCLQASLRPPLPGGHYTSKL